MTACFLGVDGGGTKTAFAIIDGDGQIRAVHEERSGYHPQIGLAGLQSVLARGVGAVLAKAGLTSADISNGFFGLPAHGEDSRIQDKLDALPAAILGHRRYACGNDMICGWAGAFGCADGINIVAGTGSIGYGECQGRAARAGGWGEVFGDEGSAYWIAVRGLNAFSRMSDGRLPKGPLYEIIRGGLGLANDLDLAGLLTSSAGGGRDNVAALSRLVTNAYEADDGAAIAIFDAAASDLAAIVETIARRLGFSDDPPIPVSYSGGVFSAGTAILRPLAEALSAMTDRYQLFAPEFVPVIGAALYAAHVVPTPISVDRIVQGLRTSVSGHRLNVSSPHKQ